MSGSSDSRRPGRARRVLSAFGLVLLAVYLPHVAPLFGEHLGSDGSCRANWLRMLPILPGILPDLYVDRFLFRGELVREVGMAIWTVVLIALFTWLAAPGGRRRVVALVGAVALSSVNAGVANMLFAL